MSQKILNKRSYDVNNGAPKLPTSDEIDYGEIAINYATDYETMSIKNDNDEIVTFSSDKKLEYEISEIDRKLERLEENFLVKQYSMSGLSVTIPAVTTDPLNTDIPKFVFKITGQEAIDYQVIGMLAYEVFDANSGGNRLNFIPVCQFTGGGQTELSVRGCVMGTTSKVAKRISCWILLKLRNS